MSKLYGWWSAQAARNHGYSIYKTPDGVRINVTHVTHDPKSHGTCWPDIRFKGEVTDHCGNIRAPEEYEEEYEDVPLVPHDEMTFKVLKNRTPEPKTPCPLAYTGTGQCTCGNCTVRTRLVNRNPFGY